MAIDEMIHLCEPTQVRHMMSVIEPQFQRDFISLLPKVKYQAFFLVIEMHNTYDTQEHTVAYGSS